MNHKGTEDARTFKEHLDGFADLLWMLIGTLEYHFTYIRRLIQNRLCRKTSHSTLRDVLGTGEFGYISAGMTLDHLMSTMGEPDTGRGNRFHEKLLNISPSREIWSYGDVVVFSHELKRTVEHFKVSLTYRYGKTRKFRFPTNIMVQGYFPNLKTTFDEFELYLRKSSVDYVVLYRSSLYSRWPVIHTASGRITINFDRETPHNIKDIYVYDNLDDYWRSVCQQVTLNLLDMLNDYVSINQTGYGYVLPCYHYQMFEGKTTTNRREELIEPDVSYLANVSEKELMFGQIEGIPELSVEIVYPFTKAEDLQFRIRKCLDKGTKQVWVVYPDTKEIIQHIAGDKEQLVIYKGSEKIDADALFPGIEGLTTDAIFKLPKWAMKDDE